MKIGPHEIGAGRCFVIAEAGINHDGHVGRALMLVDVAADAGADAVKFQTFRAEELGCTPDIAACELPPTAWPELAARAAERGLVFLSTPFDCESVDLLDPLVPAFKIASGEITNERLLRHVASKGKPVILSTGMATQQEVIAACETLCEAGHSPYVLLHCVSAYPAPPSETNLRAVDFLRWCVAREPDATVGLSDHTLGDEIAIAAVAMGAAVIEKHLTLDRKATGPDHHMSMEWREFAAMVKRIRNVEAAMGDGIKRCQPSEEAIRATARRDPVTGKRP